MSFYDEDFRALRIRYPLVAKKIEELRCETVNFEQFQEELKKVRNDMRTLAKSLTELLNLLIEERLKK